MSNHKKAVTKKNSEVDQDGLIFKEMEASINGVRVALNMQVTLVLDLTKNLKRLNKRITSLKHELGRPS